MLVIVIVLPLVSLLVEHVDGIPNSNDSYLNSYPVFIFTVNVCLLWVVSLYKNYYARTPR